MSITLGAGSGIASAVCPLARLLTKFLMATTENSASILYRRPPTHAATVGTSVDKLLTDTPKELLSSVWWSLVLLIANLYSGKSEATSSSLDLKDLNLTFLT